MNAIQTDIAAFDVEQVRSQFPVLAEKVRGKDLVYLDNAASAQKPQVVIDAVNDAYSKYYANVHRGVHYLSDKSTRAYEAARKSAQKFLNAAEDHEIIFTKGTTDGINLVADTFGQAFLNEGDEVLISEMEHHSGIVPWQMACRKHGAKLRVIPVLEDGQLDLETFKDLITKKTKIISLVHVSNTLGTHNPAKKIIEFAHERGIPVLLDGAQATPHMRVDVSELDVDFYVLSGHKIFGPTGIGVLYGKSEWLNQLPPYQGGGAMIKEVTFEETTYNILPEKFEAGTPNIAGAIGMGVAMEFLMGMDMKAAEEHEQFLLKKAMARLDKIEGLRVFGNAPGKAAVISFLVEGAHANDLGMLLDGAGVAVRVGHHCTQPLLRKFGVNATVRASFAFYNTEKEVDTFVDALENALQMLR